jgi:hypothetical protein
MMSSFGGVITSFFSAAGSADGVFSWMGFVPISAVFFKYFCLNDSNFAFFLSYYAAEGSTDLASVAFSNGGLAMIIAGTGIG